MPTLDYTGSSVATAPCPSLYNQFGSPVVLYRRLTVADIIAADAVMAAAGYIAIADVIQAIHVPAGFHFQHAIMRVITPCTASVTACVGIAGTSGMIAQSAMDAAAGTTYMTITTDTYGDGDGYFFAAADTIDVTTAAATCLVGDFEIFIIGWQMVLGS